MTYKYFLSGVTLALCMNISCMDDNALTVVNTSGWDVYLSKEVEGAKPTGIGKVLTGGHLKTSKKILIVGSFLWMQEIHYSYGQEALARVFHRHEIGKNTKQINIGINTFMGGSSFEITTEHYADTEGRAELENA